MMQNMQGYAAEPVGSSPKAGLSCLHCELLLREPVQTEEGLRLCKACFAEIQSFEDGTCKKCGVTSSETCYPDKAVRREVLSLLVYCAHRQHGCTWQGPLKEWEAHCSDCEYQGIPCSNEGCSSILPKADMEEHLKECQYRLISCEYCAKEVPFEGMQRHLSLCEECPVICSEKMCGETFLRKNMLEHKSHHCKVVACLSCSAKVLRATGQELCPDDLPCPLTGEKEVRSTSGGQKPSTGPPSAERVMTVDGSSSTYRGANTGEGLPLSVGNFSQTGGHVHLSDPLQSFQHHQVLAEQVQALERGVASMRETQESVAEESTASVQQLKAENSQLKSELSELKGSVSDVTDIVQTVRAQLSGRSKPGLDHAHLEKLESLVRSDSERASTMQYLKKELVDLQREVSTLKEKGRQQQRQQDVPTPSYHPALGRDVVRDGPNSSQSNKRDTATLIAAARSAGTGTTLKTEVGGVSESRLAAVEKRVEEIAKQLTLVKVHGQELELQLQASLASTHNGSFLWRIPDVSRRRRDAVDERVTSIYSPPFYTGRNGYKMCIRAYLNGDGMGYKTHLSLFFVLMKGESDPLLKWPFEYKVSMILVDQTHRKHIVQTFKPTAESSSFQQPTSDMNVASGCPQFAKLTVFNDDSYVNNDVMFIKCIVDITKIFHP